MSGPRGCDGGNEGVAYVCDLAGFVRLRVPANGDGARAGLEAGAALPALLAAEHAVPVAAFLERLREQGTVFDFESPAPANGGGVRLFLSGARLGDSLIVIVTRAPSETPGLLRALIEINNEQTNCARRAAREASRREPSLDARDGPLYEALTAVNNELVNLQRELTRSNLRLERLNREKNHWLGMAAHDMRSPLGAVLSYTEFLEDEAGTCLDEEQRGFLARIRHCTEFMLGMLDDLLDVSSIEAGHLTLERRGADLGDVVGETLVPHRLLAERKSIALEYEADASLPLISVDAARIEQVMNNLLTNAIKFSHPGGRIAVGVHRRGPSVSVSVRDGGVGIPPEDLAKVFQPFGIRKTPGTQGEKGTGLGLAIVRKIVEGHGGTVSLTSERGRGTCVGFELPIARAVPEPALDADRTRAAERGGPAGDA